MDNKNDIAAKISRNGTLTRADLSVLLQLSLRQVDRVLADGELPFFRVSSSVRVRVSDFYRYLVEKSRSMTLLDAALFLSFTPESVERLVSSDVAPPHEVRQGQVFFNKPGLHGWRRSHEPPDRIFASDDDRAKVLKAVLARKGFDVDLLYCSLCRDEQGEPHVAVRTCALCGQPACRPHTMYHLRNGKEVYLDPDVACSRCVSKFNLQPY